MSGTVLLAGGGLANALIAWRLRSLRPELRLIVLEAGPRLGGNHTWSFHGSDLSPAQHAWFAPLIQYSWQGHELRFPNGGRHMAGSYHSLTGEHLHRVVSSGLGDRVVTGAEIVTLTATEARLRDGRVYTADAVIDGRGDDGLPGLEVRWQKFLGQVLRLVRPHGLTGPVLMDATVPQRDGYRFLYTLPLEPRLLLIEDTYYSDGRDLDAPRLRREIAAYAAAQGYAVAGVEREEVGMLPIVLDGDIGAFWRQADPSVPRVGVRAALFHMTTGYSLPAAVALADDLAARPVLTSAGLAPWLRARSLAHWRQQRFFRFLNRLLFVAAGPAERYRVMQHFYRLPEPLVGRFYAGRLAWPDHLRILSGTPPIPISRALKSMLGFHPVHPAGPAPGQERGTPP